MELDNKENHESLKSKIKSLDNTFPEEMGSPENIWEQIEYNKKRKRNRDRFIYMLAVASISGLIFLATIIISQRSNLEFITYRPEMVDSISNEMIIDKIPENALDYINKLCNNKKTICRSPEFKELKKELEEINDTIEEINKQRKIFGNDPFIVKAQRAAENQKAYLLNEIIQILRS